MNSVSYMFFFNSEIIFESLKFLTSKKIFLNLKNKILNLQPGMAVNACNSGIQQFLGLKKEGYKFETNLNKLVRPHAKNIKNKKRTQDVAQW